MTITITITVTITIIVTIALAHTLTASRLHDFTPMRANTTSPHVCTLQLTRTAATTRGDRP
jgi:hypothetical protein